MRSAIPLPESDYYQLKHIMEKSITELFEKWVDQSRIEGGSSAFFLNVDGMAALEIDRGIVINFQAHSSPPKIVLYALLGPLPETNRSELMTEMLEANLMWYATNGATLAMQRGENSWSFDVVLEQSIAVHKGTAVTELQRVFDNMCLVALDWKTRLENEGSRTDVPSETETLLTPSFTGLA